MNYTTIEGAWEIFRSLGCLYNENCIFIATKDVNKDVSAKSILFGGAVGSFANGMVRGMEQSEKLKEAASATIWLINHTERGIGIVPLKPIGIQLIAKFDKCEPQLDKFVFVPFESISSITVKDYALLNKKTQSIQLAFPDGTKLNWAARIVIPEIPYQQQNFTFFMNKYKK